MIGNNSHIGHLTYCKDIDRLVIGDNSGIGNNVKITGFSINSPLVKLHGHFSHIFDRKCELVIGNHVGITSNHYLIAMEVYILVIMRRLQVWTRFS